jgi:hypothetical protein
MKESRGTFIFFLMIKKLWRYNMTKIGLGIDYSNICKNYHTAYLDRDNTDRETTTCMKEVMQWMHTFLSEFIEAFGYDICPLNATTAVKIEDVASKRFLFYSLEKGITLQSFVLQQVHVAYTNLADWESRSEESIVIQNDEEGEAIYFYFTKDSPMHQWIINRLNTFSLDEVPLPTN